MNTVDHFTRVSPSVQSTAEIASWLDDLIEGQYNQALTKKRHKLNVKIDKFIDTLVKSEKYELAFTFNNLIHNELSAIIRACFLAGLAYGLTPCPDVCIEDYINEAVIPIEKENFKQWMVIEASLRQLADPIYAKYNKLDLRFARHKGLEQEAVFLYGMEIGSSLTGVVSHQEEI